MNLATSFLTLDFRENAVIRTNSTTQMKDA